MHTKHIRVTLDPLANYYLHFFFVFIFHSINILGKLGIKRNLRLSPLGSIKWQVYVELLIMNGYSRTI